MARRLLGSAMGSAFCQEILQCLGDQIADGLTAPARNLSHVGQWRKRHARGEVIVVRYADDFIIGFQDQWDAQRFRVDLKERMEKFALSLNEGNPGIVVRSTPRIRFRCPAKLNSKASLRFLFRGLQPAESCNCCVRSEDWLGFLQSAIFANCFSMLRS